MACTTVCVKCGRKFDRFSGLLVNLSEEFLPTFYSLPSIIEAAKNKQHTTLCSHCLVQELGRPLSWKDLRFKNNKVMTATVSFLLLRKYKDLSLCSDKIQLLKSEEKSGLTPFKRTQLKECLIHYGVID